MIYRLSPASESVPLDYHNSSAGVSQIALSRMKATTKTRKGTILYNPGKV